ncbi:hypothetical protein [Bremerella sp. P1]|uniref:hypothetical protein n=1 Tax=Bremerella sp. P1 TaxID=3026424 RepID=UPI0023677675|nr:hypothetical protein [Bremerella sp. P1]WDI44496.1 hypothetical protein PSR63_11185 [Bremerella sp. P1]
MTEDNHPSPKPKRRWLRFGLRGLMVLVLLLSLPMGWIARDVYRSQREDEVVAAVEKAGGFASYDYQQLNLWNEVPHPPGPWILRKLFGDHIHAYVDYVTLMEPDEVNTLIPMLANCHRLEYLELHEAVLSDQSVETIAQMPKLRELALIGTSITVDQMRQLSQAPAMKSITLEGPTASDDYVELLPLFSSLEDVALSQTTVTDRGMQSLGQLSDLKSVSIEQAPAVTNDGFAALANCPQLSDIWADGTKVDEGCIDTLKKLPELDDVYISPGDLEVEFYAWGTMRLDTLKPVKVTAVFTPICGTCAVFQSEKTGPRIVDVDTYSISVNRYDEDEVEDLPQ